MTIDAESLPFRELVDAAPDGILVADQAGVIVLANAEAERMNGSRVHERGRSRVAVLGRDSVLPSDDV